MRNLKEYPIMRSEVENILQQYAASALSEQRLGDIRPLALSLALEFLSRNQVEFAKFLKGKE